MLRARAVGSVAAAAVLAAMLAVPTGALALTSVEGAVIGDQGYYWFTPAESWIFPHRIGNIDNRVMLQWGASTPVNLYNLESIQRQIGGGFVLELMDNMNLGLWVSEYTPGMAGFVQRGINETSFGLGNSAAANPDLEAGNVDPYDGGVEAGRKLDLFASFWLPDAALEAGARLW
ncbi:MAG: hypothetical protein HYZ27_05880 [Deltaproteobacteria bacterium]|nr:hypothetical protein [Deltaproteobacteria bacterium]